MAVLGLVLAWIDGSSGDDDDNDGADGDNEG